MKYLKVEQILLTHARVVEQSGGDTGVRDLGYSSPQSPSRVPASVAGICTRSWPTRRRRSHSPW